MAEPQPEEELDRLYALPLAEFIGARNELAKRLRAAGDRAAADRVKALAKPSVTAWAVNALYHHERQRFDELLAAAAAVRAALAGRGDRKPAEAARRQALRALLGRAATILAAAGHAATPANRQRISHTLETLAARDPAADGPRPGRLAADLEPQGFDVLAGLAASLAPAAGTAGAAAKGAAAKGAAARRAAKRPGKRAAAAARVEDERLAAARRQLQEAEAELAERERLAADAEALAGEAKDRHERLAEEAAEATRAAAAAKKAAEAARQAAAGAKKEVAAAGAEAARTGAARRRAVTRVAAARRQLERHQR